MRHYINVVALIAGTILPIGFAAGISASRRIYAPWIKVMSIIAGVAGVAWGILDSISLYGDVTSHTFHQLVDYRETAAFIAVVCIFMVAVADHRERKRRRQATEE
jgi:hypothetical protein